MLLVFRCRAFAAPKRLRPRSRVSGVTFFSFWHLTSGFWLEAGNQLLLASSQQPDTEHCLPRHSVSEGGAPETLSTVTASLEIVKLR